MFYENSFSLSRLIKVLQSLLALDLPSVCSGGEEEETVAAEARTHATDQRASERAS